MMTSDTLFVDHIPPEVYGSLWNYRTKEHDHLYEPPSDYSDYIPQDETIQNLYRVYLQIGESPADAALKAMDSFLTE